MKPFNIYFVVVLPELFHSRGCLLVISSALRCPLWQGSVAEHRMKSGVDINPAQSFHKSVGVDLPSTNVDAKPWTNAAVQKKRQHRAAVEPTELPNFIQNTTVCSARLR